MLAPIILFVGSLIALSIVSRNDEFDTGRFTNLDHELEIANVNIDRQNNIIIGIAVGVMVVACGIIYVAINVNS